jgi:trans-aconitate methyltransferase
MPARRRRDALPRMYTEIARWFHLITAPEDYAVEARFYRRLLLDACEERPGTLLELGSGGGNNASHLKRHFAMTLVDLSPRMLALSRRLNPECEHRQGDMRSLRLGREFDAVFVHDAVMYMTSARDLRRAMRTAFVHCRPGGAALFVPDHTRETFRASTKSGGHDGADGRALRYLEWVWDPDPRDSTYTADYAYLLRDRRGRVRALQDRHVAGLFSRRDWLRWLRAEGFRPRALASEDQSYPSTVFVAKKPSR